MSKISYYYPFKKRRFYIKIITYFDFTFIYKGVNLFVGYFFSELAEYS